MKKKRKRSSTPRHKRLNRVGRLKAAKYWIPKYEGKNRVKGYSVHFGVDKLCAVQELACLGIPTDIEYIHQLKRAQLDKQKLRERRNRIRGNALLEEVEFTIDEYLAMEIGDEEIEEIPF